MTDACCDLCGSNQLEFAYRPPTSTRGLAVYICQQCSLAQSLPRIDHAASRVVSLSSGADWGNVRYGKGFRTREAFEVLASTLDLAKVRHCLDVGSNRGDFVLRLHEIAPDARILAVEPDEAVVTRYKGISRIHLTINRIEHTTLPPNQFDLVYCSHTLEHLRSPREILGRIRHAMTLGGVLFAEVPNLSFIGLQDVVEEWFIDKHLYHFSPETLAALLRVSGFRILEGFPVESSENITIVARAEVNPDESSAIGNRTQAQAGMDLITQYALTLDRNHLSLQAAARRIEAYGPRRVVVWGAGRIFDSLVRYGCLDVGMLSGVVDSHLASYSKTVHGCVLLSPEELPGLAPEVVVIASRSFFDEIKHQLGTLIPECTALGLTDLLAN